MSPIFRPPLILVRTTPATPTAAPTEAMRFSVILSALLLHSSLVPGCSSEPGLCGAEVAGRSAKFVVDRIDLPTLPPIYGIDLDGDGKPENRLAELVGWLDFQSVSPVVAVDQALSIGEMPLLLDVDPGGEAVAKCAEVSTWVAKPPATPPSYSGADVFSIDHTIPSGTVSGAIVNRLFKSESPSLLHRNDRIHVELPLIPGGPPVPLDLSAAFIKFQESDGRLVAGQIDGALEKNDLENNFLPAMTEAMEANERARRLMDVGDGKGHPCENGDGTLSVPGDGLVGVCEVAENLWPPFLEPDVQLFDGDGNYHPTPHGQHPDSISIGFGFSAVPATF